MRTLEIFLKEYYNYEPNGIIQTGDIFSNLPTFGLLNQKVANGIIITPSCDLANRKTTTVTYLPILSFNEWLLSNNCLPLLCRSFKQQAQKLKLENSELINQNDLNIELLEAFKENLKLKSIDTAENEKTLKQISLLERIIYGLDLVNTDSAKVFLNSEIQTKIKRLITNSENNDVHFLPFEKVKKDERLCLKNNSLVLFRYPITVPYEIFDVASNYFEPNIEDWQQRITSVTNKSCYSQFENIPIRMLRLKDDFLSDLLTRFVSLYVRLGSRDFKSDHQEFINNEILKELN